MFKQDGVTYSSRSEWELDNKLNNATRKKKKAKRKRHHHHFKNRPNKTGVWHLKDFTMDIPLTARCALRLTKPTNFHTSHGMPNNYDWKHSKIQIVMDDKPIIATAPGNEFETGDIVPVQFEIGNQVFHKDLINVKKDIFTVTESQLAKRIIKLIQKKHL